MALFTCRTLVSELVCLYWCHKSSEFSPGWSDSRCVCCPRPLSPFLGKLPCFLVFLFGLEPSCRFCRCFLAFFFYSSHFLCLVEQLFQHWVCVLTLGQVRSSHHDGGANWTRLRLLKFLILNFFKIFEFSGSLLGSNYHHISMKQKLGRVFKYV